MFWGPKLDCAPHLLGGELHWLRRREHMHIVLTGPKAEEQVEKRQVTLLSLQMNVEL